MVEEHNKHEALGRVELDTDEARGGSAPGVMRYVLMASMVLVIVAFVIIWWAY